MWLTCGVSANDCWVANGDERRLAWGSRTRQDNIVPVPATKYARTRARARQGKTRERQQAVRHTARSIGARVRKYAYVRAARKRNRTLEAGKRSEQRPHPTPARTTPRRSPWPAREGEPMPPRRGTGEGEEPTSHHIRVGKVEHCSIRPKHGPKGGRRAPRSDQMQMAGAQAMPGRWRCHE